MYMDVLLACTCVHHVHFWYPKKSEEGIGDTGTGAVDDCELPCGGWESNPGPLQEQVFLTKPSYQAH